MENHYKILELEEKPKPEFQMGSFIQTVYSNGDKKPIKILLPKPIRRFI